MKNKKRTVRDQGRLGTIVGLAGMLALQAACSSDGVASGSAVVLDRTTNPLLSAQIAWIDGTYGAECTNRTGAWSVEVAVAPGTMTNAPLTVVMNDPACELTLTGLHATSPASDPDADPVIVLGTSYAATASSMGTPIEFWSNAKLGPDGFASDFVITLLYSDDATRLTDTNTAAFQVSVSTATALSVPAPDYAIDIDGLVLFTDVDDAITSATGSAALSAGSGTGQLGQNYVVRIGGGLTTYALIDAAYTAVAEKAIVSAIPVADFTLGVGVTLPLVRTLIISNLEEGVRSYQAFTITFNPPTVQ
jgi:hypothetical protein